MGEKLLKFYEQAYKLGGIKAQMRLAILTLLPSTKAKDEPDSQENIQKFEKAMKEIEKEFENK
ncbi:MAG: hypothetical protein N2517_07345 [Ignavibacteria bacterium]|nr:hypothetical protein [Ignavibacteria bacterium]